MKNNSFEIIQKGNIILRNISFSPAFSDKQREMIEKIWIDEKKKNYSIFNGQVLAFVQLEKQNSNIVIDTYFTEYKNIIASRKLPSLQLGIKQIGVSAITIINDNNEEFVLFSRRSENNTEYPGYIELVPSGNIDRSVLKNDGIVDYILKLKDEFSEETGMSSVIIRKIQSMCLLYDKRNEIFDVGCIIEFNANQNEIRNCFNKVNEYKNPEFVKKDNVLAYINKNKDKLVPTSFALTMCYFDTEFQDSL